jgi:hypothetical protein
VTRKVVGVPGAFRAPLTKTTISNQSDTLPKPAPIIADVGLSISGIPGPP